MKQDEYPTVKRWGKINPKVEFRWARQKTDHQAPTSLKVLGLSHHYVWGPTRRRAIKKHNILVVSDSFMTNDYFPKLIWKIIPAKNFSKFVH